MKKYLIITLIMLSACAQPIIAESSLYDDKSSNKTEWYLWYTSIRGNMPVLDARGVNFITESIRLRYPRLAAKNFKFSSPDNFKTLLESAGYLAGNIKKKKVGVVGAEHFLRFSSLKTEKILKNGEKIMVDAVCVPNANPEIGSPELQEDCFVNSLSIKAAGYKIIKR